MKDTLLLGVGRHMMPAPKTIWQHLIDREQRKGPDRLEFMTEAHHRVRDFAVRELTRCGQPLTPGIIAQNLDMQVSEVVPILEDLERNLTFLYRNTMGAVVWAYPVTAEETPHHITIRSHSSPKSSEKLYAA